ncbi:MAG: hypothetical protein PHZ26_05245 [Candidatus Gracilibacteria bacterium]|nr:hypothetical protein [Candidatus Gracilibacteria bacterium]MDD2909122.1 hypothetical protein [Candidatus Gracilibacteria bacterium]
MKKKNIFLLTLGYLGGIAVAMKYSKKNATETKKALEKSDSFLDVFIDNVVSIHKDVLKFFEQKIVTDDNKKLLEDYKQKALDEVEKFKVEANKKVEELKEKGVSKKDELEKEIKDIYDKRQEYFDKAKELGEEYADEAVAKGKEYLNEGRKRLDIAFEEMKKKIK